MINDLNNNTSSERINDELMRLDISMEIKIRVHENI